MAKEHHMSTMTFTPATVSPVNALTFNFKIFLREARYEFVRLSRTRSFAFSVIGFPVAFYLFFGLIMNRGEHIGSLSVAK
jgi:ABC-2 type transport system permease protein